MAKKGLTRSQVLDKQNDHGRDGVMGTPTTFFKMLQQETKEMQASTSPPDTHIIRFISGAPFMLHAPWLKLSKAAAYGIAVAHPQWNQRLACMLFLPTAI